MYTCYTNRPVHQWQVMTVSPSSLRTMPTGSWALVCMELCCSWRGTDSLPSTWLTCCSCPAGRAQQGSTWTGKWLPSSLWTLSMGEECVGGGGGEREKERHLTAAVFSLLRSSFSQRPSVSSFRSVLASPSPSPSPSPYSLSQPLPSLPIYRTGSSPTLNQTFSQTEQLEDRIRHSLRVRHSHILCPFLLHLMLPSSLLQESALRSVMQSHHSRPPPSPSPSPSPLTQATATGTTV